jgi:CII-binding regulator of phage lambda lysogenization HflD
MFRRDIKELIRITTRTEEKVLFLETKITNLEKGQDVINKRLNPIQHQYEHLAERKKELRSQKRWFITTVIGMAIMLFGRILYDVLKGG